MTNDPYHLRRSFTQLNPRTDTVTPGSQPSPTDSQHGSATVQTDHLLIAAIAIEMPGLSEGDLALRW